MTVSNVDFIWSHIFEECPGMCWSEIFLNFQNQDTTTPHFFLICCPKFCSFVQILNEVSCECFTWLKIWYATTSSLQNYAKRCKLFPWYYHRNPWILFTTLEKSERSRTPKKNAYLLLKTSKNRHPVILFTKWKTNSMI